MPTDALMRFVQLLDSAFPSGAFVHSYGLEPHIVLESVTDEIQLRAYLQNYILDQYGQLEFPFVARCYDALKFDNLGCLKAADCQFSAMQSDTFAKASRDVGCNYLDHLEPLVQHETVKAFYTLVRRGETEGNELAVLSAYAFELGLTQELFLTLWAKKNLMSIAMCALKISRIKPSQIQTVLFTLDSSLQKTIHATTPLMGNFNPFFEQYIYQHRRCEPKLFMT
jgi:urease accessory protein